MIGGREALLAVTCAIGLGLPAAAQTRVSVEHGEFVVTTTDGRLLSQQQLVGAVLALGDGTGMQRQLRIDAIEIDPVDPLKKRVLYAFSERDAVSREWRNACDPGPDGLRLGFPLDGAFTSDMHYVDAPGKLVITCTGGAEGKCVRFGYEPWGQTSTGASLRPYYQACVRLVRADYLGDGIGHTKNGTPIDIFDRIGIQADESAPDLEFEAAFGPNGAVCVRHTRYVNDPPMAAIEEMLPGRVGAVCDEAADALLFVRSRNPDNRP